VTSPEVALTGSRVTVRGCLEVCSAHARIFPAFFFTRVVVQNVGTRDPEGVPLGARMRNRVFPRFFWYFDWK
jgi:hypothetical protein